MYHEVPTHQCSRIAESLVLLGLLTHSLACRLDITGELQVLELVLKICILILTLPVRISDPSVLICKLGS